MLSEERAKLHCSYCRLYTRVKQSKLVFPRKLGTVEVETDVLDGERHCTLYIFLGS